MLRGAMDLRRFASSSQILRFDVVSGKAMPKFGACQIPLHTEQGDDHPQRTNPDHMRRSVLTEVSDAHNHTHGLFNLCGECNAVFTSCEGNRDGVLAVGARDSIPSAWLSMSSSHSCAINAQDSADYRSD
ncbi:hypothetical protein WOLCODRAFT_135373 [Wolfiporia cocos MD-104 SS10]|uniref:Uncharacterized protein n=1 Tax=Wolfiporia cocos (strain MD-104) TaxID=742152 RepID=A0A2H3IV86_WOLCO|nr:hypothetical protein WOLCODRAFT_135373 [Wolfiporia cocos MD-104 SS10]